MNLIILQTKKDLDFKNRVQNLPKNDFQILFSHTWKEDDCFLKINL